MTKADKFGAYHKDFADRIIEELRKGTAVWLTPCKPGERVLPVNFFTRRAYTGGNSLYLHLEGRRRGYVDTRWATFRQIQKAGGMVWKGEKSAKILFFDAYKRVPLLGDDGRPQQDENGKRLYSRQPRDVPFWRRYSVFNVEQAHGLDVDRPETPLPDWQPHAHAEAVIEASRINVRHFNINHGSYNLRKDLVALPQPHQFPSADNYYATALHECGHATGHPERMNRATLIDAVRSGAGFGSPAYAREELRAEISAMMTGQQLGLGHQPQHAAAYTQSWIKVLEDDPREIHRAAADAENISRYLLEPSRERPKARTDSNRRAPGSPEVAFNRTGGRAAEQAPANSRNRTPRTDYASFLKQVAALNNNVQHAAREARAAVDASPQESDDDRRVLLDALRGIEKEAARGAHSYASTFGDTAQLLEDYARAHDSGPHSSELTRVAHAFRQFPTPRIALKHQLLDGTQYALRHLARHQTDDRTASAERTKLIHRLGAIHARRGPLGDGDSLVTFVATTTRFGAYAASHASDSPNLAGAHQRLAALAERFQPLALYEAARRGRIRDLRAVLDSGADPNSKDAQGRSALQAAALHGGSNAAEILVGAGADPNIEDALANTPLHLAAAQGYDHTVDALLHNGANPNPPPDHNGATPLHRASAAGHSKVVRSLLTAGATVDARNPYQRTPLHLAAAYGDPHTVQALIQAGAHTNALDTLDDTPLHRAAGDRAGATAGGSSRRDAIRTLIDNGADPSLPNVNGETPIDIARNLDWATNGGSGRPFLRALDLPTHGRTFNRALERTAATAPPALTR